MRRRSYLEASDKLGFKALSRMSSSPTQPTLTSIPAAHLFQSAVAHELFSDFKHRILCEQLGRCFKALSRMSSSPTRVVVAVLGRSVKHEFQSAVAHELFSDRMVMRASGAHGMVSKRCRA